MLKLRPITGAEGRNKIRYKFILWFLGQRHVQQLEFFRRWFLPNAVGETEIAREAQVKVLDRELVEFAIVQSLHPQSDDGFDFVAFRAQRRDEFSWKVLVQQDFHTGCSSF